MANCHELFQHYNRAIKLSDEKREMLIGVRESLRKRMKENYLKIPSLERRNLDLNFQSQGSFVMDTIIKPLNDDFDLDDGVYFQDGLSEKERPAPQVFHNWVIRAIDKNVEYENVKDKTTCVRVQYKVGFHIDIPIYYADNFDSPYLAETKKGWLLSNPVEFIAWFEGKTKSGFQKAFIYESLKYAEPYEKWLSDIRKKDCQIRRLVRYMKAWGDLRRSEMPSGIIMTILIGENFAIDDRDDISFRDTLVNIRHYLLTNGFKCPRPTTPIGEDLFAEKSELEKQFFMNALNALIQAGNTAIMAANEKDACKEWEKHFGTRFPCHMAKDKIPPIVKNEPNLDALKRTAVVSTPWYPEN
ncbi:MAG: CBASS cGAMP synthase [Bacteroidales bacterium]|jgi:hypothetical protein